MSYQLDNRGHIPEFCKVNIFTCSKAQDVITAWRKADPTVNWGIHVFDFIVPQVDAEDKLFSYLLKASDGVMGPEREGYLLTVHLWVHQLNPRDHDSAFVLVNLDDCKPGTALKVCVLYIEHREDTYVPEAL